MRKFQDFHRGNKYVERRAGSCMEKEAGEEVGKLGVGDRSIGVAQAAGELQEDQGMSVNRKLKKRKEGCAGRTLGGRSDVRGGQHLQRMAIESLQGRGLGDVKKLSRMAGG